MLEKHPYDEVAYGVYQLANELIKYGYGRIGKLDQTVGLREFVGNVRSALAQRLASALAGSGVEVDYIE
jgi:hypothetical protein